MSMQEVRSRATTCTTGSYAYNKIFKKIGATSFSFEPDPSGTLLGGSSAYMTPRDWARFGQLYLQVQLSPEVLPLRNLQKRHSVQRSALQDAPQLGELWAAVLTGQ